VRREDNERSEPEAYYEAEAKSAVPLGSRKRAIDDAALDVRTGDQACRPAYLDMIGSVLRVIFDDEDRRIGQYRLWLTASTSCPMA
jgi:hypothetical protein